MVLTGMLFQGLAMHVACARAHRMLMHICRHALPQHVYAITKRSSSEAGGLWRSADGGSTWADLTQKLNSECVHAATGCVGGPSSPTRVRWPATPRPPVALAQDQRHCQQVTLHAHMRRLCGR